MDLWVRYVLLNVLDSLHQPCCWVFLCLSTLIRRMPFIYNIFWVDFKAKSPRHASHLSNHQLYNKCSVSIDTIRVCKNILLIFPEHHINFNPIHLPIPPCPLSTLAAFPIQNKQNKTKPSCGSCVGSRWGPTANPKSFTWKCWLQWVIGLVRGFWLSLHCQYWILTGISLKDSVVALCHGDPDALLLWNWPLLKLQ